MTRRPFFWLVVLVFASSAVTGAIAGFLWWLVFG
ncbi:hypothetical protein BH09PSE4_BH09PSE4_13830 [soil metagenome]